MVALDHIYSLLRVARYRAESPFWATRGLFCKLRRLAQQKPTTIRLEQKNWGKVAVLGRGKSAELICEDPTLFDVAILCNFRNSDLTNEKLVTRLSEVKTVFLLSNIYEPIIGCGLLQRIPVSEVVWCGFLDGRDPGRKLSRGRLQAMGFRVKGLPDDFDASWLVGFQKNTGISAVRLASLRSDEVSLFGIEFYTNEHLFVTPSDRRGFGITRPEYGEAVREAFQQAIDDFPRTSYRLYALNNHPLRGKNLRVILNDHIRRSMPKPQ